MSFYNSRYYKSSQKEQARHEGEHDASRKYEARIAELEQQLAEANRLKDFLGEQIDELGNHLMLNHQSDFGVNREKPLGEGACEMAIRLLSKQGAEG